MADKLFTAKLFIDENAVKVSDVHYTKVTDKELEIRIIIGDKSKQVLRLIISDDGTYVNEHVDDGNKEKE